MCAAAERRNYAKDAALVVLLKQNDRLIDEWFHPCSLRSPKVMRRLWDIAAIAPACEPDT